jgi:transposase-like protein
LRASSCNGRVVGAYSCAKRKGDIICSECGAGFRRIELGSRRGTAGEFRCPLCNHLLEVFDGSTEVAYRLTVAPENTFE